MALDLAPAPGSLSGQVLVLDNYDSFTYNLVQYLRELGSPVVVYRNDQLSIPAVADAKPAAIVISPGPGIPEQAGICVAMIAALGPFIPILGVCLGHQAIAVAYGGQVIRAPEINHGKVKPIYHQHQGVFRDLPSPFQATRYHSLIVAADSLPESLEITAWSNDGLIMGLRHKTYPMQGVQFHPESIGTPSGKALLANFLQTTGV